MRARCGHPTATSTRSRSACARPRRSGAPRDNHGLRDRGSTAVLPTRLRVAGFVLPSALIALLVALDYVLEPIAQPVVAHVVLVVVGIAGVLAFSTVIFGRFTELYRREEEQAARLRALNIAGMSLTSQLDTASVLQRV